MVMTECGQAAVRIASTLPRSSSPAAIHTSAVPPNDDFEHQVLDRLSALERQVQSLSERQDALSLAFRNSEESIQSHTSELAAVKSSVSELIAPPIIGGFKAQDSIHVFVPGSSPLQEGIIAFLTKRAGGNVCDRQAVHAFSTSE
jgi:hypothetical protein